MNEIPRRVFADVQVERLGLDVINPSILITLDIGRRFPRILIASFQDALIRHSLDMASYVSCNKKTHGSFPPLSIRDARGNSRAIEYSLFRLSEH
ncbi:hypothetical protein N9X53_06450 [Mariniblastus sp.]|nr:hypothetical protein [Mariniblastus sp.]